MVTFFNRQQGVTLLEALLTLAIGASLLVMGLRVYQSFKRSSDMQQISYNTDAIGKAAAHYYYANCKNGTLDQTKTPVPTSPYALNITNDLVKKGYLSQALVSNPYVSGYTVQFTRVLKPKMLCTATNCTQTKQVGTNVIWSIQVSAQLTDPKNSAIYQQMTGATCITSLKKNNSTGKSTLLDCSQGSAFGTQCINTLNAKGSKILNQIKAAALGCGSTNTNDYNNYISWQISPAMTSSSAAQSTMWTTRPQLLRFKQKFETDPDDVSIKKSHSPEYQYFQCGS
jgi:type II secretory pathway pseudopilin PulG